MLENIFQIILSLQTNGQAMVFNKKTKAHKYTAQILSMAAFTDTQESKQACSCSPVRSNQFP